ncbi:MAG: flippase [Chloroflexi bacterium]|nr:flippase [Chloroflexota bacterium]
MSGLATTVLRNSFAGIGAQAAIKVLSFGFSVLVVRQLGAEQFGQYAAVLAFGATFVFLADLGLGVFTVREVSRWRALEDGKAHIDRFFGNVVVLRVLLGCVAAVLIVLTAWATDRPTAMLVALAVGAVGLMVYSAQGACEAVLAGFERLHVAAAAKVVNQLAFVVLGAIALIVGAGYHGLVVANLVGVSIMAWLCWRGVRRLDVTPGRPSPDQWLPLLRASAPFAVIAGTLGLSYKFDSVLLNIAWGDTETGYYNAAYSLVFASVFLSNALNTALYPSLTRQAAQAPESLPSIYGTALRYLMSVSLPIAVGGFVLSDQIVALLFGAGFVEAGPVLAILILVVPLMFASELLGYVVVIGGAERSVARAVLVSTGINILCNLVLVPWFGLFAAATMTVVTEGVLVGQYVWYLRATLAQISWQRTLILPLVATGMMGVGVLLMKELPTVVTILLAAVMYGMLLVLLGVVQPGELAVLRSVGASMRPRPTSEPLVS